MFSNGDCCYVGFLRVRHNKIGRLNDRGDDRSKSSPTLRLNYYWHHLEPLRQKRRGPDTHAGGTAKRLSTNAPSRAKYGARSVPDRCLKIRGFPAFRPRKIMLTAKLYRTQSPNQPNFVKFFILK